MKTITYIGIEYEVPDWVKFVVADANGEIFGYDMIPTKKNAEQYTLLYGSLCMYIGRVNNYPLVEV